MSEIIVLDEQLANKIAAGEVIERVSSIVKELVENSIDAKSKNIDIILKDGGLKEINIIDDGVGMSKEDATLAFSRHATSKIKTSDDLFFINSLGFRGEAIPSIASVSEVELITNNGKVSTKIIVKAGKVESVTKSPSQRGTSIKVTKLFYNTPARLKFLKSESSELRNVVNLMEKLSMANPSIGFSVTNNDKVILKTSGSDNLHKTIHEIYGLEVSKNMLYLKNESDDFIIEGYISKPSLLKTNRNYITTFVNDRLVKNTLLNKSINEAYYTYKPADRFPIIVLNIYVDPTLIDVNIHPTKQDIKLSKIDKLNELIYESIKDVLYKNLLIPEVSIKEDSENVEEDIKPYEELTLDLNVEYQEKDINEDIKSIKLYPVGLVHGTYIVAENEEGMYIIDQHAAAERINYEIYKKAFKEEKFNIKEMLFPITIEMLASDYIKFKEKSEEFLNLGFNYEEFGINTIIVKNHPDYLKEGYEEEQIRKIIDLIITLDKTFDKGKFQESLAITLSCKMSVKGNTKISISEMEYLLDELMKCDNPYTCPHGRPTIIKYSVYDLEKLFKRAK